MNLNLDFKPLVDNSDSSNNHDFNTIDLEKITIDTTNNVTEAKINITDNEKQNDKIVTNTDKNGNLDLINFSQNVEEKKVYDTLKEPVLETLVKKLFIIKI